MKKIDTEAFYAESFIRKLGEAGLLSSVNKSQKEYLLDEMYLVEETAKVCMTTAFCLWCHLAALTYVRQTKNDKFKENLLSSLENGEILAGTGLSNPMKYYAGLEKLQLSANLYQGAIVIRGIAICFQPWGGSLVWIHCWCKRRQRNHVFCSLSC